MSSRCRRGETPLPGCRGKRDRTPSRGVALADFRARLRQTGAVEDGAARRRDRGRVWAPLLPACSPRAAARILDSPPRQLPRAGGGRTRQRLALALPVAALLLAPAAAGAQGAGVSLGATALSLTEGGTAT